jgi:hypothetical protein
MTSPNPTSSYLAAGQMPWKLLRHQGAVVEGKIVPIHLQFNPTNRCNGKCSWCSCYRVDRALEMSIGEVEDVLRYFRNLGTRAITITGGGEPIIHADFPEILSLCKTLGIKVGLVTNGLTWKISPVPKEGRAIVWIRVSAVENGLLNDPGLLATIARQLPATAVGVSYTVNGHPDLDNASGAAKKKGYRWYLASVGPSRNNVSPKGPGDNVDPDFFVRLNMETDCADVPYALRFRAVPTFFWMRPETEVLYLKFPPKNNLILAFSIVISKHRFQFEAIFQVKIYSFNVIWV